MSWDQEYRVTKALLLQGSALSAAEGVADVDLRQLEVKRQIQLLLVDSGVNTAVHACVDRGRVRALKMHLCMCIRTTFSPECAKK